MSKSKIDSNFKKKKAEFPIRILDINDKNALKYIKNDSYCSKYLNYLKDNTGEIIIDENDDKLAGYIFVGKNTDAGFISTLEVKPKYRGYGLSEILLKDAINKYSAIDLVVDKDNEVAIKLYKKFKFSIIKDLGNQYWMKLRSAKTIKEAEVNNMENDVFEMPKERSLEEILDSTDKNRIFLSSDWHILKQKYKHEKNQVNTAELIKWCKDHIKDDDVFIYLGDLSYRYTDEKDFETVQKIYKSLPGIKVLILGNHDIQQGEDFWKDCGFDFVFYEFLYKDILFTHRPVDMILRGIINGLNIHGHIHDLSNDYDFLHPDKNVNVFPGNYNNKPITLQYILDNRGKLTKDNKPNGTTDQLSEAVSIIDKFLAEQLPIIEAKRSELSDDVFGVPQERKFPLDTEAHVRSAIKMFNYVEPKYEKQLATKIKAGMKRYNINDISISDKNRLSKYIKEDITSSSIIPEGVDTIIFDMGKILVDDLKADTYSDPRIPAELRERIYKTIGDLYFTTPRNPEIHTFTPEQAVDYFINNAPEDLVKYTGPIFEKLPEGLVIYNYSMRLVSLLKERGYKVYYLSNWDRWSYELGEKYYFKPLLDLFDGGIFSFEVGIEKPSRDIYEKLIDKYGLTPNHCVFFDDKEENILMANNVGIKGIQITDTDVLKALCDKQLLKETSVILLDFINNILL